MWGLAAALVGALYGWLTPGLQNRDRVLWTGAAIGLAVALAFALLGAAIDARPLPIGAGAWGSVLAVLAMTVLFAAGVWLGDLLQRHRTATS